MACTTTPMTPTTGAIYGTLIGGVGLGIIGYVLAPHINENGKQNYANWAIVGAILGALGGALYANSTQQPQANL